MQKARKWEGGLHLCDIKQPDVRTFLSRMLALGDNATLTMGVPCFYRHMSAARFVPLSPPHPFQLAVLSDPVRKAAENVDWVFFLRRLLVHVGHSRIETAGARRRDLSRLCVLLGRTVTFPFISCACSLQLSDALFLPAAALPGVYPRSC